MQSFDSISRLALPPDVECRMRELMRRRSEGTLSASERRELDLLTEAQEFLTVLRTKARTLASTSLSPVRPSQSIRNGLPVVLVPPGTPAIDPVAVRHFLEEQIF